MVHVMAARSSNPRLSRESPDGKRCKPKPESSLAALLFFFLLLVGMVGAADAQLADAAHGEQTKLSRRWERPTPPRSVGFAFLKI